MNFKTIKTDVKLKRRISRTYFLLIEEFKPNFWPKFHSSCWQYCY